MSENNIGFLCTLTFCAILKFHEANPIKSTRPASEVRNMGGIPHNCIRPQTNI